MQAKRADSKAKEDVTRAFGLLCRERDGVAGRGVAGRGGAGRGVKRFLRVTAVM